MFSVNECVCVSDYRVSLGSFVFFFHGLSTLKFQSEICSHYVVPIFSGNKHSSILVPIQQNILEFNFHVNLIDLFDYRNLMSHKHHYWEKRDFILSCCLELNILLNFV